MLGQQDSTGLGDVGDALRGTVNLAAVVRMHRQQSVAVALLDQALVEMLNCCRKPEDALGPADVVTVRRILHRAAQERRRGPVCKIRQELAIDLATPGEGAAHGREHAGSQLPPQRSGGIHRPQHMLGRRTGVGSELESQFTGGVIDPVEPVRTARQSDPVGLKAVAQPRLSDPTSGIQVEDQRQQLTDIVRCHVLGETSHDPTEQQTTEPGWRITAQERAAERNPTGRRNGPGMEHFKLSEQHRSQPIQSGASPTLPSTAMIDGLLYSFSKVFAQNCTQRSGTLVENWGLGDSSSMEQPADTGSAGRTLPSQARAAIGIDVGGTEIKGVVANALSTLGATLRRPSAPSTGGSQQILDHIVEVASVLKDRAAEADVTVVAAGIGIPGAVDSGAGVGTASANLGWQDFPIREAVSERLGMPTYLEHDVYLGALAEFTIGSARQDASSAFVPLGTGTGCALMLDRRSWRGATRFAGEIGHVEDRSVALECPCGRSGCAELLASARGLERVYAARSATGAGATARQITRLAQRKDAEATAAWDECIDGVAAMLAGLVLTTDIESIVLGGGLSEARRTLTDALQPALTRKLNPLRDPPTLRLSALGSEAGARGAALHALSQHGRGRRIHAVPSPDSISRPDISSPQPDISSSQPDVSSPQPDISSSQPDISMLAFDHRTSAAKKLFGTSALSRADASRLAEVKSLIAEGALAAVPHAGATSEVSILTDPEYGLGAVAKAHQAGTPVALALERSGLRELALLNRELLVGALGSAAPVRWGKVLVRWSPRDSQDRKTANLKALESAKALCESEGMEFLCELIVPATPEDLELAGHSQDSFQRELLGYRLPEAVWELTRQIGPPHLWKIQGVESPAVCEAVAEAATQDGATPRIVVLGAAADQAQISRWFGSCAATAGYCGFAIGRSIWDGPIRDWLAGRAGRRQTRQLIASSLLQYVDDYAIATRVRPLDPPS